MSNKIGFLCCLAIFLWVGLNAFTKITFENSILISVSSLVIAVVLISINPSKSEKSVVYFALINQLALFISLYLIFYGVEVVALDKYRAFPIVLCVHMLGLIFTFLGYRLGYESKT